jgi:hypothetical protein
MHYGSHTSGAVIPQFLISFQISLASPAVAIALAMQIVLGNID